MYSAKFSPTPSAVELGLWLGMTYHHVAKALNYATGTKMTSSSRGFCVLGETSCVEVK